MMAALCERIINLFSFNPRSCHGEAVQLQSALNDDYNKCFRESQTLTTFQKEKLVFSQNMCQMFVHFGPVSLIHSALQRNAAFLVACVAGVNGEGEGEQERWRKMGDWGLGTRERLLQRPLLFHFCGRQRQQNFDWLIFDSKSHGNDVI